MNSTRISPRRPSIVRRDCGASRRHQAPLMPQPAVSEFCSGCFAYLEFSASLEPESYAMRGQETETPKSLPAEGEPSDRLRERRVGLFASSKQ